MTLEKVIKNLQEILISNPELKQKHVKIEGNYLLDEQEDIEFSIYEDRLIIHSFIYK